MLPLDPRSDRHSIAHAGFLSAEYSYATPISFARSSLWRRGSVSFTAKVACARAHVDRDDAVAPLGVLEGLGVPAAAEGVVDLSVPHMVHQI